ncbi:VWA domain-containing protein [Deinococcus arenae]|jgi:Ca-activated chloride channel family protein|uniref:VWA domain-containing protein n=1 Tax=Deinococcus arenae TaxID=1452751 RepID=A0A8H9GRU9_9DEIO|nr:VWA domain-containing protein [Deinococcus arenae]GGM52125.1 VWA domain-containing protein [Deinococcus arenae]
MTVKIDYTLYRPYVLVGGEEFLNYLLVNVIPDGGMDGRPAATMPMAMVPVIDVSGSMYAEERLETVQRAAHYLIDQLKPVDTLGLVAFADRSQVASPLTQGANATQLHRAVDSMPELNVGGGTSMAKGFKDALTLLQQPAYREYARRILLLTDGHTFDEAECLQLARQAQAQDIVVSVIGVGSDWNEDFLKQLASIGGGDWTYIRLQGKPGDPGYVPVDEQIQQCFAKELSAVQNVTASGLQINLELTPGVAIRSVKRSNPQIQDLNIQTSDRTVQLPLGPVGRAEDYLMEVVQPPRKPGLFRVMKVSATYRSAGNAQPTTVTQDIVVQYTSNPLEANQVNPQVQQRVQEVGIHQQVEKATRLLASGDVEKATRLLRNASNVTQRLGDPGKTRVLNEAIEQLAGGQISEDVKKTIQFGASQTRKLNE